MPLFLRCTLISLVIHAMIVGLIAILPMPARDPLRFLRHAEQADFTWVEHPSVAVVWYTDMASDSGGDDLPEGDVPEFADAVVAVFPDMPNIQPKQRAKTEDDEAIVAQDTYRPAPSEAHDSANTASAESVRTLDAREQIEETSTVSQPLSGHGQTEGSLGENAENGAQASGSSKDVGRQDGRVPDTGVRGGKAKEAGGKATSGHAESVDEESLWKNYARQLALYFAAKRSYPPMARRLGHQGMVWIDMELTRSGKVIHIALAKSSGSKILDDAALELVQKTKDIPPFPENTTAQKRKIRIPLEYAIRRQ